MSEISNDDVRTLISKYCFSSDVECAAMVKSQPELFQGELLESLVEARALMQSTGAAYDESDKLFSALMRQLDLPGDSTQRTADNGHVQERHAPTGALSHGSDVCRKEFELLLTKLLQDQSSVTAAPSTHVLSSSSWLCRNSTVSLNVLSYLTAAELLGTCENTCGVWRSWLCDGATANPFWVGVVQREFPQQLASLLSASAASSPDTDPFDQDWRTIAMLGVCSADGTTDALLNDLAEGDDTDEADDPDDDTQG